MEKTPETNTRKLRVEILRRWPGKKANKPSKRRVKDKRKGGTAANGAAENPYIKSREKIKCP